MDDSPAQAPSPVKHPVAGCTAAGPAAAPCARLVVRVLRGEGLLPMDTVINPWRLSLEHTLDAFVQLRSQVRAVRLFRASAGADFSALWNCGGQSQQRRLWMGPPTA